MITGFLIDILGLFHLPSSFVSTNNQQNTTLHTMKFNTVAGGLLLTALEAFASPIDVVGVPQELTPAHDLEARIVVPSGPAWCCVGG